MEFRNSMKFKMQAIASGSNGNCFVFETDDKAILIDNGISFKKLKAGLDALEIPISKIRYVLITHAHSDHIAGLPVFSNHSDAIIVATEETIDELLYLNHRDRRYSILANNAISLIPEKPVLLDDFEVTAYSTFHDIMGASGFHLHHIFTDFELSYATDTADITPQFKQRMKRSEVIFLESNHCSMMLKNSARPSSLKMRIRKTHLNNVKAVSILSEVISDYTKIIFLGHISGECNKPENVIAEINNLHQKVGNFDWIICPRDNKSTLIIYDGNDTKLLSGINSRNVTVESNLRTIEDFF